MQNINFKEGDIVWIKMTKQDMLTMKIVNNIESAQNYVGPVKIKYVDTTYIDALFPFKIGIGFQWAVNNKYIQCKVYDENEPIE